ncbi:hypothetical protein EDB19DRAFT_370797 [Suillus lakei]|nr:hypothetical protein EDB19DRAFT_370797 [Suillus lakei]
MSTTSLRSFPNSLLNPILPSSPDPIHNPARTSMLSAFSSFGSKSNPAPSRFTPPSTYPLPHQQQSRPIITFYSLPQTSLLSHLSNPHHHVHFLLAQVLLTCTSRAHPQLPSLRSHRRAWLRCAISSRGFTRIPREMWIVKVLVWTVKPDRNTMGIAVRVRIPGSRALRRIPGIKVRWLIRRVGAWVPGVSLSTFETQDQSAIADSSRMCLDTSSGEMDRPSPSVEANAEAFPHVLEAQLEGSGVEQEAPLPASEAHPEESEVEPEVQLSASQTQSPPRASSNSPSHMIDLDALQKLIHGHELPLWPALDPVGMGEDGERESRGSGQLLADEYGEVNGDFGGPSIEESLRLDHTPDTGGSDDVELDSPHESGRDDYGECEREEGLQIELEGGGLDGTLEESVTPGEEPSDTPLLPIDTPKPTDTRDGFPREYHPEHLTDPEDSVQPELDLSERRQPAPLDLTCLHANYLTSTRISMAKTPANKHLQILSFKMKRPSLQHSQLYLPQ